MTKPDCDQVVMAAMAVADGYQPELTATELESHLAGCSECRQELEEIRTVVHLLETQERRHQTADIWQLIEYRVAEDTIATRPQTRLPFIFLGLGLLGYRLLEMVPDRDLSLVWKVLPILLAIVAFSYLRVNPFKINADLRFEGESK